MTNRFTNFDGTNLDNFLGHEMIEIKENFVKSKLKIEDHHKQPMGLVHGGIYATLSETICSYGANFLDGGIYVGVNNNTDFLTSVESGEIICVAEPIKVGKSYQLWESKIYHNDKLCAVSKVRLSKIK
ncbi:MAG: thioesterase [Actinobacteria bacterium]|nr:thioesterase [Actinomycetota bacterium]